MTPKNITIDGIEYDLVPKTAPSNATKQRERDWQVESYSSDDLGVRGEVFKRSADNVFVTSHPQRWNTLTEEALINNKATIRSVRRIIDNCIFSIGDSVDIRIGAFNTGIGGDGWQRFTSEITKFNIFHDEIFIECGSCSGSLKEAIHLSEYASKLPERTKQDECVFDEKKINERLRQIAEMEEAFNAGKFFKDFQAYCDWAAKQILNKQ